MEYGVLGPLEVHCDGRSVTPSSRMSRRLLGVLLVHANQTVSADTIVEALWRDEAPRSPRNAVQVYVSGIRKTLHGAAGREVLHTRPSGYQLDVGVDELDLVRFHRLCREGRARLVSGEPEAAARSLESALALWRGRFLADTDLDVVFPAVATRLEEERLSAHEDLISAQLECGRQAALVGVLEELVAEHPLRERRWEQLMTALYRCGRQADALAAYGRARDLLASELGCGPGPGLERLRDAVLAHAPELAPPPSSPSSPSSAPRPAQERRLVTVVACDVLAQGDDPEDVRSATDQLRLRFRETVEEFGATVAQAAGPLAVAVFGAPVAHGDEARRGVRCAMALLADPVLPQRAAVATGEELVTVRGDSQDLASTDVLDRALRLVAADCPAGILVDASTREAARTVATYREVDPVGRGPLAQDLRAWEAVPTRQRTRTVPFLGRSRELAVAEACWQRVVQDRTPAALTVLGAPGVGKSRLAVRVGGMVRTDGGRVLTAQCSPFRDAPGYTPFVRVVTQVTGVQAGDPAPDARARLSRVLDGHVPPAAAEEVAAHLALMLGLPDSRRTADEQPILYAARRFLEALAAAGPTLLVLEDAHWADPSLLALIRHVLVRTRDVPLMVMAVARPELVDRAPAWTSLDVQGTSLSLGPLRRDEAVALAAAVLRDPDPATAAQIADRSEGNPLFVEELAATADETGEVGEALPVTVRNAIAARLDALPEDARSTAMDAAVVGPTFSAAVLARLAPGRDIAAALEVLELRDVVRRHPTSAVLGHDVEFRHALIRDVAYAMLPRKERQVRHGLVADHAEQVAGSRTGDVAAYAAQHRLKAGQRDEAAALFVTAARSALQGWAKSEAIELYSSALALLPVTSVDVVTVRLERAGALMADGQYARAADEYDALLPHLDPPDALVALLARMKAAWWLVDSDGVRRLSRRASELARRMSRPELAAPALALQSHVHGMEGRPADLIDEGRAALEGWPAELLPADLAYHLELVGLAETWVGDYTTALTDLRRSHEIALSCHSVEAAVRAGATLGLALAGVNRHADALAVLTSAIDRGREHEAVPRFTGRALNMRSMVRREVFDLERSRLDNAEAAELGRRSGFSLVEIQAGIDLAFTDLLAQDLAAVVDALPRLWEATAATQGFHQWLMTGRLHVLEAEVALASGRVADAHTSAQAALRHASATGRPKHQVSARRVLAGALGARGDGRQAVAEGSRAVAAARELGHLPTLWTTLAAAASVSDAVGEVERAQQLRAEAVTTVVAFAGSLPDDLRGHVLGAPQVRAVLDPAPALT